MLYIFRKFHILLLSALLANACAFREPIEYRFELPKDIECEANNLDSSDSDLCAILSGGQRMLLETRLLGAEILVIFYPEDVLRAVHLKIFGDNVEYPLPSGQAGLIPVYFRFHNTGSTPIYIDTLGLSITDKKTGKAYYAVTPESYMKDFQGSVTGYLPYYWSFAQRKSFSFFHRETQWYKDRYLPRTGSPLEEKARKQELIEQIYRIHYESGLLYPGQELRSFVLFPELPEGSYILTYSKGKTSYLSALIRENEVFRLGFEQSRPFQYSGSEFLIQKNYLDRGAVLNKGKDRKKALTRLKREWGLVEAEREELYNMHRQYFDHDELKSRDLRQ